MIGKTVSRYQIIEHLGAGGMGIIYKAIDTSLGRQVAVKFLPENFSEDQEALKRFKREARAASALNHPNICTIHDIGEHDGRPFIVMELLEGQPLNRFIDGKPLANETLLAIATQIADALHVAHSKGVVHRDIKSSNVFVTNERQTKVLDFGLAKVAPTPMQKEHPGDLPTIDASATNAGSVMGTISYMSPEQVLGQDLDSRSDLFSFGVVLYEMATGMLPFREETWTAIANAIINTTPLPVLVPNPTLPQQLVNTIEKALEKDRNLRYQTAADMKVDLARAKTDSETGFLPSRPKSSPAERRPKIAVLPFADLSPQKDQEYFCDGIAEELINRLSQLSGLRIASRTSGLRNREFGIWGIPGIAPGFQILNSNP